MHAKLCESALASRRVLRGLVVAFTLMSVMVTAPIASAKTVQIADTGFSLTVPDEYRVSQPLGAPNILLHCDRPDGNGSIQVVRAGAGEPIERIAADYEAKMTQALGNFTRQSSEPRAIAGRPGEFRLYRSVTGNMIIRIMAAFYQDGTHGFTVHSLDTTGGAPEFEAAVCSLTGPAAAQAALNSPAMPEKKPRSHAPAMPAPGAAESYHEATTGLLIPHPAGWVAEKAEGSVTLSGAEGTPAYNTTISVQALRRSDPANRDLATAVKSFSQGLRQSGAEVKSVEPMKCAAGAAYGIYAAARMDQPGEPGFTHLFRYVLIERPGVIAVVSYVAPIADWNGFLPTVDRSIAGIRAAGATPPATARTSAAGGRTSVDAWKTLNGLARAQDWELLVEFLEPEAVRQHLLPSAEDLARRSGLATTSLPTEPCARLRAILERAPAAAECVEYLQRDNFKLSTREENANQHLVMVQHGPASNQQTYYWMRRINGRWLHTPN